MAIPDEVKHATTRADKHLINLNDANYHLEKSQMEQNEFTGRKYIYTDYFNRLKHGENIEDQLSFFGFKSKQFRKLNSMDARTSLLENAIRFNIWLKNQINAGLIKKSDAIWAAISFESNDKHISKNSILYLRVGIDAWPDTNAWTFYIDPRLVVSLDTWQSLIARGLMPYSADTQVVEHEYAHLMEFHRSLDLMKAKRKGFSTLINEGIGTFKNLENSGEWPALQRGSHQKKRKLFIRIYSQGEYFSIFNPNRIREAYKFFGLHEMDTSTKKRIRESLTRMTKSDFAMTIIKISESDKFIQRIGGAMNDQYGYTQHASDLRLLSTITEKNQGIPVEVFNKLSKKFKWRTKIEDASKNNPIHSIALAQFMTLKLRIVTLNRILTTPETLLSKDYKIISVYLKQNFKGEMEAELLETMTTFLWAVKGAYNLHPTAEQVVEESLKLNPSKDSSLIKWMRYWVEPGDILDYAYNVHP